MLKFVNDKDKTELEAHGTLVNIMSDVCVLIAALADKAHLTKEDFMKMVDVAFMSEEEAKEDVKQNTDKIAEEVTDLLKKINERADKLPETGIGGMVEELLKEKAEKAGCGDCFKPDTSKALEAIVMATLLTGIR